MDHDARRARFHRLHEAGTFLMPNAHDAGAVRLLDDLGFVALATTSSGFAASLGQLDMTVTRDQLVAHVAALVAATDLPVSVDAERCFPEDHGGVAGTVALLAAAGAAGCSIEDWDPHAGCIEGLGVAAARVEVAAAAAHEAGMVLTARAENHLRGVDDLDDTIARLTAYRDAGAACVFAPGVTDVDDVARLVDAASTVSVLLRPGGPTRDGYAAVGVRRLSVGGSLAFVAYGALHHAATRLRDEGALAGDAPRLDREVVQRAFSRPATP